MARAGQPKRQIILSNYGRCGTIRVTEMRSSQDKPASLELYL